MSRHVASLSFCGNSLNSDIAQNDVEATWAYITAEKSAKALRFDTSRTAVYGSSIGCSLAGGLAIRLKDKKEAVKPRIVVLDR